MVTKKSQTLPKRDAADQPKLAPHVLPELSPSPSHARTHVENVKIRDIIRFLYFPADEPEERKKARIRHALEIYEGLDPSDAAEAMLVRQMIGVHFAAQECFASAGLAKQTPQGRDLALRQGEKLSALYVKQLAAYDKRRGKGQQKLTVEHVHVHSGGQAIVGHVEAGRAAAPSPEVKQLENSPGLVMSSFDGTPVRQRVPVRSGGNK